MNIQDCYRPFTRYFRKSRNARFISAMNLTAETTVLDVGGTSLFWSSMPITPNVTLLNIRKDSGNNFPQIEASACDIPCADKSFDIVFRALCKNLEKASFRGDFEIP
jgi:hypothetical protein